MKIAFFTDTYKPQTNGVVKSIESFSKELEKGGHKIHIFCPKDEKTPEEKRIHQLKSLRFKPYPEYRIGLPSARVIKNIKKINPDLIHLHGPCSVGLSGLSIAKYKKIPTIMTYHTSLEDYVHYISNKKIFKKYNKKITKKYIKWFLNKTDLIISPSNPIKEALREYGVKKPIRVLPTGIEIQKTKKVEKFDKPTILHVGRITREKRIKPVVRAFAKVSKKTNSRMVIASDGPYKKQLEGYTEKLGLKSIEFTGYVGEKEIINLYKKSHVFVCASRSETQGLVVLEAMAYGCPVIVANYMGFKDFVNPGENGLLFNKDENISKKIIKIFENKKLREKLVRNGYKTAREYTIERCTEELEKIYRDLIGGEK